MQLINKKKEPDSLEKFKSKNKNKRYTDLPHNIREDIRDACTREQFFLCAYCCKRIKGLQADTTNEHIVPRSKNPSLELEFTNIVASCNTPHQCDAAHVAQDLPLTPLMSECENEIQFMISGEVRGTTPRANESIRVLNLGHKHNENPKLVEKRKQLALSLLFTNGIDPDEGLDDIELLEAVISDLLTPANEKLDPFAPVAANILRQWIDSLRPVPQQDTQ